MYQDRQYVPEKREQVRHVFNSVNFSYVLSGSGRYRYAGREWTVEAPAVVMQWPGVLLNYGPAPEGSSWEELFVMYPPEAMAVFAGWGIDPEREPLWRIRESGLVREQADLLLEVLRDERARGWADRIDRLCERLLLEARLGEERGGETATESALRSIRDTLARDLRLHHDLDRLAQRHGLSPITFRRHWARRYTVPPHRYVLNLRMREARRLLAETSLPVGEIAERLGFEDALYFSRRFAREVGQPATEYRRQQGLGVGVGVGTRDR